MSRRSFLQLASASFLSAACGGQAPRAVAPTFAGGTALGARPRTKLRAVVFDLFTLFDPRTVGRIAETVLGGRAKEFCDAWRVRQFEYSWIHTAAGRYLDFRGVTEEALSYASRAQKIPLTPEVRATLIGAYERLEPWPDTRASLEALKRGGLELAPLANYTPTMIENLLNNGGVRGYFDEILSTDRVKSFKPDPRAYAMGPSVLGFRREEVAFSAFGGWDAAGAAWYGMPTFWVNRLGAPSEELAPGPDATGPTLKELVDWAFAV
jgi:2-haloacid dehalogenase